MLTGKLEDMGCFIIGRFISLCGRAARPHNRSGYIREFRAVLLFENSLA